jgi:hypothetical protein
MDSRPQKELAVKKAKFLFSFVVGAVLIFSQVTFVSAARPFDDAEIVKGVVQSVTLETDANTGGKIVLITILDDIGGPLTVRISEKTAFDLELVDYDVDGNPFIVVPLPGYIEISPEMLIPEEAEEQHPVGSALATYFSDIPGLNYDTIMNAHQEGNGFGGIAHVLWLTRKLGGDAEDFLTILEAKQSGDFSNIQLTDGTQPLNWGQFKKAVMDGDKKSNLGIVISNRNNNAEHGNAGNNGNSNENGNGNPKVKDKEKKEKSNGSGNGNGNTNRP